MSEFNANIEKRKLEQKLNSKGEITEQDVETAQKVAKSLNGLGTNVLYSKVKQALSSQKEENEQGGDE